MYYYTLAWYYQYVVLEICDTSQALLTDLSEERLFSPIDTYTVSFSTKILPASHIHSEFTAKGSDLGLVYDCAFCFVPL